MELIPFMLGNSVMDSEEFYEKYLLLMQRYTEHVLFVINKTRDYHNGLHFCDELDQLTEFYRDRLTRDQYRAFLRNIARIRLTMYDKLDYWEDYIRYHDELFETTDNFLTYVQRDDYLQRFGRYFMSRDKNADYVHWLFQGSHRYDLIEKKLDKLRHGKKVGNLRHRSQSELSEEEIHERFYEGLRQVQILMGG